MKIWTLTFLICGSAAICFSQVAPNPSTKTDTVNSYRDADAFDVYSAVLPTTWPLTEAKAKSLVIRAEARNFEICLYPKFDSEAVIGSAIRSYQELTKQTWEFSGKLLTDRKYQFVPSKTVTSITERSENYWDAFYKAFPDSGGIIEFSPVGFNNEKTVAVFYSGYSCGWRCGGGQFYVLKKVDGKWVPLKWAGSSCSWNS